MGNWHYRFENYRAFLKWRDETGMKRTDCVALVDVNTHKVYVKEKQSDEPANDSDQPPRAPPLA